MQHTHHITIAGWHSHANSYRRVRSERPGQHYERREPGASRGVYLNCHHHRRNERRVFEHHVAIRGWCNGSFRVAVDPRRGEQPDSSRDQALAPRRAPQPPIVTPANLTTSQASVVLDASGSTSASGSLQYLFEVVPGGKQAALLQTPTQSQSNGRFCKRAGTLPGSAGDDGRERQHFEKSRDYVDLPAIGRVLASVLS